MTCHTPLTCALPGDRRPDSGQKVRAPADRGSVLVEFGLIAAVLFMILLGLIEGGMVVRARNAVDSAADEAARRGATAANHELADWLILEQIQSRGVLAAADINFVVVFRADSGSAAIDPSCLAGTSVADVCNVYSREDFDLGAEAFGCESANLDSNWCPAEREVDNGRFEYLGVHIDAQHSTVTGMFGDVELVASSRRPVEGSGGS